HQVETVGAAVFPAGLVHDALGFERRPDHRRSAPDAQVRVGGFGPAGGEQVFRQFARRGNAALCLQELSDLVADLSERARTTPALASACKVLTDERTGLVGAAGDLG